MFLVGDLESDGLLSSATTIWCGSFYCIQEDTWFYFNPLTERDYVTSMVSFLQSFCNNAGYIVCHNIVGFDSKLIRKISGVDLPPERLIDTLLLSKMFFPDKKGHKKPHSLEAWGEYFGIKKPEHEDWSQFSEEMLHRNIEDVKINIKLFYLLQQKGFKL